MLTYYALLSPSTDELSISPLEIFANVITFCRANDIDKIVIERVEIIATNSHAKKSMTHVNIDAFAALCKSRGISAVTYTPKIEYPLVSLDDIQRKYQTEAFEKVNLCRFTEKNTLLLASAISIGYDIRTKEITDNSTFDRLTYKAGLNPTFIKDF